MFYLCFYFCIEPASFLDENPTPYSSDKSIYVKDVNEHNDFKLKCSGKGKVNFLIVYYFKPCICFRPLILRLTKS